MKNPLTLFPQRLRTHTMGPFRALAELENEMDRWMSGSIGSSPMRWSEETEKSDFAPACNFKETNKDYIIQFDIPGVKKGDVKIEIENNRLMVSGERSDKKEEKDARHVLTETYYGTFMRSFNLPIAVDENKVDAHYEDGVLTITVPKLHSTKAKEIKIQ